MTVYHLGVRYHVRVRVCVCVNLSLIYNNQVSCFLILSGFMGPG